MKIFRYFFNSVDANAPIHLVQGQDALVPTVKSQFMKVVWVGRQMPAMFICCPSDVVRSQLPMEGGAIVVA
ncbi:hypothetical protein HK28_04965 [Acetobacter sp. DsW_063]|nr:hypothetical protein HK28_04965 [Acetobacter sp. DsW_063]